LPEVLVIKIDELPEEIHNQTIVSGTLEERLSALERQMIIKSLKNHKWVQTKAAEELGISERVLRYKMAKLTIKNQKSS